MEEIVGLFQGLSGALGQFRNEINSVLGTVAKFVGALNPGLLSAFNAVMQNLNATIGFGLEPVLAQATEVFRTFAGQILPLMTALRPVLADISQALGGLFTAVVSAIVTQLRVYLSILAPIIKFTSQLVGIISTLIDVYGVMLTTIVELVQEMLASIGFGDAVNDVFKSIVDAAKQVVVGLSFLGASLLRLVGLTDTLAKFRENLAKRLEERKTPPAGMVAAPKDVSTSGIEDIAKKMSERAFQATAGAGAKKSETDLLEEILKAVSTAETMDWKETIKQAVKSAILETPLGKAVAPVVEKVEAVISTVKDVSASPVGEFFSDLATAADPRTGFKKLANLF